MKKLREILESKEWSSQEGESEVLHHVSPHNFKEFRPFSHFGTADAARTIAQQNDIEKSHNYTVRLKMGKVLDANIDLAHHGYE